MTTADVTCVYVSGDASEAHLICNRLADHGVRAKVVGDALPYAGVGSATRVEVWIEARDLDLAAQLLCQWGMMSAAPPVSPGRFQFSLAAVLLLLSFTALLLGITVEPWTVATILWIANVALWLIGGAILWRRWRRRRVNEP